MAEGDLIDGIYQIELNGVLMRGCCSDDSLSPLRISEGFMAGFGVPQTRNDDKPRPGQHGSFPSPQYLSTRMVTWPVVAVGATYAALQAAINSLGTAMRPIPDSDADLVEPLVFTLGDPTQKYLMYGKPQRATWGYKNAALLRLNRRLVADSALCVFEATDPLIYDNNLQIVTAGLGSSSGGLAFPFAFPFGFGTSSPGIASCNNLGNMRTYPVIVITAGGAGASGIIITNNLTLEQWSINLSLAAGETLVIDMLNHTVRLNGTADRSSSVGRPPSVWLGLDPGITPVSWQATGAGSTMAVQVRSAWNL